MLVATTHGRRMYTNTKYICSYRVRYVYRCMYCYNRESLDELDAQGSLLHHSLLGLGLAAQVSLPLFFSLSFPSRKGLSGVRRRERSCITNVIGIRVQPKWRGTPSPFVPLLSTDPFSSSCFYSSSLLDEKHLRCCFSPIVACRELAHTSHYWRLTCPRATPGPSKTFEWNKFSAFGPGQLHPEISKPISHSTYSNSHGENEGKHVELR